MQTIIIGIGNPVRSDDGVGLEIAGRLADRLRERTDVTVMQMSRGGMWLMEAMADHDHAFLIDAATGGGGAPGTVYAYGRDGLTRTRNITSSHDGGLAPALAVGEAVGLQLPGDLRIWAVEAGDVSTFQTKLTPEVEEAVPEVVDSVLQHLDRIRQ